MKQFMLILPHLAGLSILHPAMAAMDGNDFVFLGYAQQHSDHVGNLHGFHILSWITGGRLPPSHGP